MATTKKKIPAGKKTDKAEKARKDSDAKSKATAAIVKPLPKKASKPAKPSPVKVSKNKHVKEPVSETKPAKAAKNAPKAREEKPLPEEPKAKSSAKKGKAAEGKEEISPAALQAIAAVKASSGAKKPAVKKSAVAVFTLDDVRDFLKNRSEGARELAEKKEAAAKKAAVNLVIPEPPQQARVLGAATLADILGFSAQPAAKQEPTAAQLSKRDVPAKLRKYFDMLISLREKIQAKINQRGRVVNKGDADSELAVPAQTDDDDTFDHDFALSLVANEQDALSEIDAAIDRIYDGTYGICEITGKEISRERLEAVPFARFSVEGQAQFEMQNRRRAQRMTSFMDSGEDSSAYAGEEADE